VSFNEIRTKCVALGAKAANVASLEAHFKAADADGSGELDIGEFEAAMNARVSASFKKLDADNSGNISPAELKAGCAGKDVSALLKVADTDGDGEISLKEFSEAIASKPKEFLPILFAINH
jgi:Ca2+-binding EF-hand superfamily protein